MAERDPSGKDPHSSGAKLDAGKPAPYQGVVRYFPRALLALARVSTYGAIKYVWNGWRGVPDGVNRYRDASERHRLKAEIEGPYDMETAVHPLNGTPYEPLLHRAQVIWNEMAALELELEALEKAEALGPPKREIGHAQQAPEYIKDPYTERLRAAEKGTVK